MNENFHERMQRALDQIEASLSEPTTLSLIAEASHFSPYHFARLFRAMFDDSVMNYVRKRRLSHAAHLLKEQHCSAMGELYARIKDIRGRVGTATYGICCQPEEAPCDPDRFTYIAAIEVDS
jgi:AraC-like DNA-binding protein